MNGNIVQYMQENTLNVQYYFVLGMMASVLHQKINILDTFWQDCWCPCWVMSV